MTQEQSAAAAGAALPLAQHWERGSGGEGLPAGEGQSPEHSRPGALDGIRVVELAGPLGEWCGRLLATMGADVIKVEPPGGAESRGIGPFVDDIPHGDRSLHFWQYNAAKRGITLDLEAADDRTILHRLIARADVFLDTLLPGEAWRLGLDPTTLAAEHPRLITCSITPFGPEGPSADLLTTDLVSMALGGPIQSCGYDGEDSGLPPVRPGENHVAHTAGHFACTGILAALYEREASGLGQHLEIAAHDCLSVTVEFANTFWYYKEQVVQRQSGRHAYPGTTARTQFRCADGRYINLAMPREGRAWDSLVSYLREQGLSEGIDTPDMSNPEARFAAASLLYNALEVLCATRTADELFHFGQGLGLTWAAVRAPEDWLADPHAAARGSLVAVEHPELGRTVTYPGAPFIAHGSPWRIRRRAPLLGEDNAAIFEELRLTADEIEHLRAAGDDALTPGPSP